MRPPVGVFPFHNWAFQEGLRHAENIGGGIELMLNKRCLIGAFPWRYEGLEGPCRIVCFLDAGIMSKRWATRRRRSCRRADRLSGRSGEGYTTVRCSGRRVAQGRTNPPKRMQVCFS